MEGKWPWPRCLILSPRLALAEVVRAPVPLIVPAGYRLNDKGLYWEDNDNHRLIAGPFKVLALTRDRHNEAWGVLLEWADHDGRTHRMAVARAALAGDGREVRQALLDKGLHVSASTRERNALQAFLTQVTTTARARAVSRVGWQDGCFALPDRTIAPDDADLVVYQGQGLAEHDYQEAGTLEGWKREVAAPPLATAALPLPYAQGWSGHCWHGPGLKGAGFICVGHRPSANPPRLKRRRASGGRNRSCGNGAPRPTGWKGPPNWPTKPCWYWTNWPSSPPVKRAALPICSPMVAANRAPRKTAMRARPNAGKPSFCHQGK
jgi:hypothetical protein